LSKILKYLKQLTLGRLLVLLSLFTLAIALILIFFLSGFVRDRAVHQLARDDAQQTSKLVFQSLYSAMRKGWNKKEITEIIGRLNENFPDLKINIYRGEIVAHQFGEMSGEHAIIANDADLHLALDSGQSELLFPNKDSIRYLYPVVAKQECLVCHTQSHVGAVHGVIDITYPIQTLKVSFSEVINTIVAYTLVVMVVIFSILYLQLRYLRALLREINSANEELKSFAYVVSHDLKAPLRAISSLADWISTDYADKFNEEGKEQMRLLISRVHRMDGLINGILLYSRVGRVKESIVAVDTHKLVQDVINSLAPPSGMKITIEDTLPTVMTEPTRIQQVFLNLLSNAIKYMDKPEGRIRIACSADGKQWKFSVADNGPGIRQQHFEKIFQLFQTLAPRDRVESTGVGLALVKKIVEMYGGHIWLESTVGEGSTFYFTLPRTPSTPNVTQL
jgi:signal transduction histidine kinase